MMDGTRLQVTGFLALAFLGTFAAAAASADSELCMECIKVRVGPPVTVRGPFPDELDAPFTALKLPDGSFRGFSANGATYAIDGPTLRDMDNPRRAVLEAGIAGSKNECGRWLTSAMRSGGAVLGLVHQESICDYGPQGQTDKSMAIATSSDDGLTWTDLGTIITGRDAPQRGRITGEGDCTMIDGLDGYLYAYCLRNSDWQTIAARTPKHDLTDWRKYHEGAWSEPGLGGQATAIGFVGPGVGYLRDRGWVAALTTDPWFGGLRLSLSTDKVSFLDLEEPLLAIDGSEWDRPANTDLVAYGTILNPDDGSNAVDGRFLLSYIYVPPGKGFESRYLVHHEVALSVEDEPMAVQAGIALSRFLEPRQDIYLTSTGPLTGDRRAYRHDKIIAYMLTRPPQGIASIKFAECARDRFGHLDQMLADEGSCEPAGYVRERTAGWLYAAEQEESVPVYRCIEQRTGTHFASGAPDCEGLGTMEHLLGYGLAP
ncbi:hypothetical protein O9Z70_05750 [Devosia sp. YIM 151766]|uniref:hypothetical protein n=1 Tax=Devosia sp. YIM 151766 TaxID=3017325 RepID=UPI00255CB8A9|nr:hypothetical protein [Devosia sp. YIM 151766]WIY54031.1 hypothetical protein O9Z70_05750 [Devosia sp. YIM 151766]